MKLDPADPYAARTLNEPILDIMELAMVGPGLNAHARKVELALADHRGIDKVEIDTGEAIARVTYDARLTNPAAIHDAILAAGYKPAVTTDGDATVPDEETPRRSAQSAKGRK